MDKCPCLNAKLTISGGVRAKVYCNDQPKSALSVGTVVIRDGTNNYEELIKKPSINSVELVGDKTFEDLGDTPLTNLEIQEIFNRVFV